VHAGGSIARRVLQYAGAVHGRIDAAAMRQPIRGIKCARDVNCHLGHMQRDCARMAPSGGRDHLVALRKEVRCNGRSDQSIRPDHEHAHRDS
jgi:hypothetical protein